MNAIRPAVGALVAMTVALVGGPPHNGSPAIGYHDDVDICSGLSIDPGLPVPPPRCTGNNWYTDSVTFEQQWQIKNQLICPPVLPIGSYVAHIVGVGACGNSFEQNPGAPECVPTFGPPEYDWYGTMGQHTVTWVVENQSYYLVTPLPVLIGWCWHSTDRTFVEGYAKHPCSECPPREPDCSACVWYESEGLPEGEEMPCARGGPAWNDECGCCMDYTPIIINLRGGLELSSAEAGVRFDIGGTGLRKKIPWPVSVDEGWLVLDRNGNGLVDDGSELFGNMTRLPNQKYAANGFIALSVLDDNGDGILDAADTAFSRLRVWFDRIRDGVVEEGELSDLGSLGISAISLRYKASQRTDSSGNVFRYRAPVTFADGGSRFAYDVILSSGHRGAHSVSRPCRVANPAR